jgi:glycerophosphoryl diester phosphodiesterase
MYAPRCFLYIELKAPGAERELVSLLHECPPVHGYVVASFHSAILMRIHALSPEVPLGLICATKRHLHHWSDLPLDWLMLKYGLATVAHVSTLHAAGKRVFVWTVNSEKQMLSLAQLGVDGILSDDTSLLARTLAPRAPISSD